MACLTLENRKISLKRKKRKTICFAVNLKWVNGFSSLRQAVNMKMIGLLFLLIAAAYGDDMLVEVKLFIDGER